MAILQEQNSYAGLTNKLLAKIASDYEKPDGLTIVKPDYISEFLSKLEIRSIPGIGKKTEMALGEMNCKKIENLLTKKFGLISAILFLIILIIYFIIKYLGFI